MLKVYNTESRRKELVTPRNGNAIMMYTCGPTVYNFAHIGNFRTYIFEDLLRRTLKFLGYQIKQVMNITDIDDKTIKGAIEKKISLEEFTTPFTAAFFEDLKTLNIEPAEEYPRATAYIPQMIKIIQKLLEEGVAYRGHDGCVYFSIEKFPSYGRLSHLNLDELKEGASERVESDEYEKENAADFVLWKTYDAKRDGEIFWESPFGKGRPGWHIECSAMAMQLLGEQIDIHCGGVDNMFPHHENEIAQSEAYSGVHFVRYWLHSEHLLVDGKKMSKSLGNCYTLRDLLTMGHTGQEVRYLLLQTHYRTQLNFTLDGLKGARNALERLSVFIARMKEVKQEVSSGKIDSLLKAKLEVFKQHLADDLNISAALATLFELVREVNTFVDKKEVGKAEAEAVLSFLTDIDCSLGVLPLEQEEEMIPQQIQEALNRREAARSQKKWKEADAARDYIQGQGYLIEDTPEGAKVKKRRI
jgi:cysteinyl-tRNA synthetase